MLSLDYIYKNIIYNLKVKDHVEFTGNIEYVSSHFNDTSGPSELVISDKQVPELHDFVTKYKKAQQSMPGLSIDVFYRKLYK
jgi:hypothetical protein